MKTKRKGLITKNSESNKLGNKILQGTKQLYKNSYAESRKTIKTPFFIGFLIFMCCVSVLLVVLDNTVFVSKLEPNDFKDELTEVRQEWIDALNGKIYSIEQALKNNASPTYKERLRVELVTQQKSVKLLEYLKENDIKLYQEVNSEFSSSPNYYIKDFAYKFEPISFSLKEKDISILSDYNAKDGVFDANLLYFFIAVVLVVFAFSDEYHTGTIKLVLTRPMSKTKICISKLLSIFRLLTFTWFVAGMVYLLFSLIFPSNLSYLAFNGGQIFAVSAFANNVFVFLDLLLVSFGFVALSMCISIRFKSSILTVIVPFIIFLFKRLLLDFFLNIKYLDIFENLKLFDHFLFGNAVYGGTNLAVSILVSIGVMSVMFVYATNRYRKYDLDKLK